jgi:hypothetical protein
MIKTINNLFVYLGVSSSTYDTSLSSKSKAIFLDIYLHSFLVNLSSREKKLIDVSNELCI